LDLVVVLDASTSMAGERAAAAAGAALELLGAMDLGRAADHAALVSFDGRARVLHGLDGDRAALESAVAGVLPSPGTRIDRGLSTALEVLFGPGGRSGAARVALLLSDGGQAEEPEAAKAAVRLARQRGVEVFAVGVGADEEGAALLTDLAGADRYVHAPRPGDMARVYARISASLDRCP
jgi:Mg-chelatase subunit ChlD